MKIINKFNLIKGFSLVEVMITLLILSVATVALAPMVTKKFPENKNYGVLYTYLEGNNITDSDKYKCFVSNSNTGTSYASTYDCSKYTFTVPGGVSYVNLTLVGGGGGGGGAGGSYVNSATLYTTQTLNNYHKLKELKSDAVKQIEIGFLAGPGSSSSLDCNPKYTCKLCGGKGGTSSPTLAQYHIPDNMMRGYNYKNYLDAATASGDTLSIYEYIPYDNENATLTKLFLTNSQISDDPTDGSGKGPNYYAVQDDEYCSTTGTNYTKGSTKCLYYIYGKTDNTYGNTDKKSLPKEYEIEPVEGDYGACLRSGQVAYKSNVLMYGQAGQNTISEKYGSGTRGNHCTIACPSGNSCSASEAYCSNDSATQINKRASYGGGVRVHYKVEYPGGGGGGGAAGTFVRISSFPVTQGETYTIYVGKGGEGGQGGISGSAKAGSDGAGGVSTAIFDSSGKVVFMAAGGNYGAGGTKGTNNTVAAPAVATSGRNYPKVFFNSDYSSELTVDSNFMTLTSRDSTKPDGLSANARTLTYKTFSADPYYRMNLNGDSVDYQYGGFSSTTTATKVSASFASSSTNTVTMPNGLYYRTLLDDTNSGYIGGLGGFTGFGGKAGCGGYFLGNFDGRSGSNSYTTASPTTTYAAYLKGKFVQNSKTYDVFSYYDNCTNKTPNGQTANFVAPDPVARTFGQAGAGGGGGGFSIVDGAGRGGNGQDGYLMIDWRK